MRTYLAVALTVATAGTVDADDWTGAYVGAGIGYGDVEVSGGVPGGDDYVYGVHGGYRQDFGNWVVGAEIEHDWTDLAVANATVTLDNVARAKLTLGYDFGPAMSYAVLGGAKAYTSGLGDETGIVYGIGAAYRLSSQWQLSGEVLKHEFDDFNGSGLDVDATTFNLRVSFRF